MMSRDETGHTFGHTIFIMSSLKILGFGHTTGHTFFSYVHVQWTYNWTLYI